MLHVSHVHIYPVKSLRGIEVDAAELDALGLVGDRRFMVVDENGRFLTQRSLPRMALIATALEPDALVLSSEHGGQLRVPRRSDPGAPPRIVSVWNSSGLIAEDCGRPAAEWLGAFLGVRCRLVRAGSAFHRPLTKSGRAKPDDILAFNDGYPFLVISESSLADLNHRLAENAESAVPMNRFRPNLVLSGCDAYAEDTFARIRIGNVTLRAGGPCGRCIVTTTDQETAERSREPLRTLATYRRDTTEPADVNFGQNFIHETRHGTIAVGSRVELH